MKSLGILLLLFLASCNKATKPSLVMGLPQWHLLSHVKTKNIIDSKKLPQFSNQFAIYSILKEWIEKGKLDVLISEGCEGEIDSKFETAFNGWNYKQLEMLRDTKDYKDILTLVPLKIEVEFKEKIQTVCGDNLKFIKEHQLIMSELKGNLGFYTRLKQFRDDKKRYKSYLDKLEEIHKKKITEPLSFLMAEIQKLEKQEKEILEKRNRVFVDVIKKFEGKNVAIVIGARHLVSLKDMFANEKIKFVSVKELDDTLPKK